MITGTIRVVFGISGGSKKESSDDLDSSSANFARSSWLCSTILEKDFLISKFQIFIRKANSTNTFELIRNIIGNIVNLLLKHLQKLLVGFILVSKNI